MSAHDDTSLGGSFAAEQIPTDEAERGEDVGDVVDGVIIDDEPKSRIRTGYKSRTPKPTDDQARSTPPKLDEWMDFFSRVLIRAATDFYIDAAFRDIDEEWLSDREVDRIKLTDLERDRIARPLAELAYKTKFTRKHGRAIIALAGSIDSVIQLGMWFSRVNRIAAKYRDAADRYGHPAQAQRARHNARFTAPQPQPQEQEDVSSGQGESGESAGRPKRARPNINGEVEYPSSG